MDVAVLARVSSARQERDETIETQLEFLRSWAKLHNHRIADYYLDEAVSGTVPLKERAEGKRLLHELPSGKFQAVVVYRLDRLGRTVRVVYEALDEFQQCEVAFISATEPFDTSSPFGKIMVGLLALFAEFEKETIRQRCLDGKNRNAAEGKWWGGRQPWGFNLIDKQIEVSDETAPLVLEMFEEYVYEKVGLAKMAYQRTLRGLPTPSRHRGDTRKGKESLRWHHTTIHDILTNPLYKGEGVWGGIPQSVPAIVPAELWERAQRQLVENRERQSYRLNGSSANYLLRGLMRCGECGQGLQGVTWKNGRKLAEGEWVYGCRHKIMGRSSRHGAPPCHLPYVEQAIEQRILNDCYRFLQQPELLTSLLREARDGDQNRASTLRVDLHQMQSRRAEVRVERQELIRMLRKRQINDEEYDEQTAELDKEKAELDEQIERLTGRLAVVDEHDDHLANAEDMLIRFREGQHSDREIVQVLVRSITVTKGEDGKPVVDVEFWPDETLLNEGLDASSTRPERIDTVVRLRYHWGLAA